MNGRVRIVIVNWNAGAQLASCLRSIALHGGDAVAEVIVVDNGSTDGSDHVEDVPGLAVRVERTGRNLGFGAACNIGAAGATTPYLLFLNPDAELRGDTIQASLRFLDAPENAGFAVCGAKLCGEDGHVQRHTTGFPNALTIFNNALFTTPFDHLASRPVDHVIGAFYLIRTAVFDSLGGFDTRFFLYLEDLDLSRRVRAAGYQIQYLADEAVFHKGGGTSDQVKAHRLFYATRSRIIYGLKHFGPAGAAFVAIGTLLVEPAPRLARAVLRRSRREFLDTMRGYRWLWADAPRILRTGAGGEARP